MKIEFSRQALRQIEKLPFHIRVKVDLWLVEVQKLGLVEMRKKPGWKDHQLAGQRVGQRSVYLNRSWRLIYYEVSDGVFIIEIHKHKY